MAHTAPLGPAASAAKHIPQIRVRRPAFGSSEKKKREGLPQPAGVPVLQLLSSELAKAHFS